MKMLIVMRGLPASGKSIRARKIAAELDAVVVCRDDLRIMLHDTQHSGLTQLEDEVTIAEGALVRAFLRRGKNVIVDATNLHEKVMRKWRSMAKDHVARLEVVDLFTSVEECKRRDAGRHRSVGAEAIDRMAATYNREGQA